MWKQKLKICGINLAAYSVVLIIMAMLLPIVRARKPNVAP